MSSENDDDDDDKKLLYKNSSKLKDYEIIYEHLVNYYITSNIFGINNYLKDTLNKNGDRYIVSGVIYGLLYCITKLIDDCTPNNKDYIIYRGDTLKYPNIRIGDYVSDKGFSPMIISNVNFISKKFSDQGDQGGTLFKIKVPKGSKMFYVSQKEDNIEEVEVRECDCEYEILTYPGVTLRVINIEKKKIYNEGIQSEINVISVVLENNNYYYGNDHKSIMEKFDIDYKIDKKFSDIILFSKKFQDSFILYPSISRIPGNGEGNKSIYEKITLDQINIKYEDRELNIHPSSYYIVLLYLSFINLNSFKLFYVTSISDEWKELDGKKKLVGTSSSIFFRDHENDYITFNNLSEFYVTDKGRLRYKPRNFSYNSKNINLNDLPIYGDNDNNKDNSPNFMSFNVILIKEMTFMNEIYDFLSKLEIYKVPININVIIDEKNIEYKSINGSMFDLKDKMKDFKNTINNNNINDLYITGDGRRVSLLHLLFNKEFEILWDDFIYLPIVSEKEEEVKKIFEHIFNLQDLDINIRDNLSNTPCHLAVNNRYESAIKLLLDYHKPDINLRGPMGRPVIYNLLSIDIDNNVKLSKIKKIIEIFISKGALFFMPVDDIGLHLFDIIMNFISKREYLANDLIGIFVKMYKRCINLGKKIYEIIFQQHINKLLDLWYRDISNEDFLFLMGVISGISHLHSDQGFGKNISSEGFNSLNLIIKLAKEEKNESVLKVIKQFISGLKKNHIIINKLDSEDISIFSGGIKLVNEGKVHIYDVETILTDFSRVKKEINNKNINDLFEWKGGKDSPLLHIFLSSRTIKLSQKQREYTFDYLIDINSINLEIKDHEGKTPLHRAVMRPRFYELKKLLERNVSLNVKDNNSNTPLSYNITQYKWGYRNVRGQIFDAFIDAHNSRIDREKLDINQVNKNGRTLLQVMITKMADPKIAIPMSEYFIKLINVFEKEIIKTHWWNMLDTLLRIWSYIQDHNIYKSIIKIIDSGGGIDRIDMNDIQNDTIGIVGTALKINKDKKVSKLINILRKRKKKFQSSLNNDNILTKRKIPEQTPNTQIDLSGFDYTPPEPESKKKKISTLIGKNLTNEYCDHCDKPFNEENLGSTTEINGVTFIVCSQNCSDKIYYKISHNI
jgi:ankyrin repeat protein